MGYWFTTYQKPDWTPDKQLYTDLFKFRVVRAIREHFSLEKKATGTELTTGKWVPYLLEGQNVMVTVDKFTWMEFKGSGWNITPVLRLDVRTASKVPHVNKPAVTFWTNQFRVEFPTEFPMSKPEFYVENRRYREIGGSEAHNLLGEGRLCILADNDDWKPREDTVLSGFNVALQWAVRHYNNFKW